MIQYIPFFICILGLLLYVIERPSSAKIQMIGEKMFFAGLLVTLLQIVFGK